jgi:hypothetical protein
MQSKKEQAMQNTITLANNNVVVIAKKQLPMGNNFVVHKILAETATEVECVVRCTATSKEPGRLYYCNYTLQGDIIAAQTLN